MTDLASWDFLHSFSGREVAALMIGIDPGNVSKTQEHRIEPVSRAILSSYLPPMHHPETARDALVTQEYGQWILSVLFKDALCTAKNKKEYENIKASGRLHFDAQVFERQEIKKWPRLFEQLSPIYKWTLGGLPKVQSCPRRRASLATNAEPRWATRGAPGISFYAASSSLGNKFR